MKQELLNLLCDPVSGEPLDLDISLQDDDDDIIEGILRGTENWYPVIEGVPRMLTGELRGDWREFASSHRIEPKITLPADATVAARDADQARTTVTFSEKWNRFKNYGFESEHQEFLNDWYVKKLGLNSRKDLPEFYAHRKRILEIGPGSGFNTHYMASQTSGTVLSVDISDGALTTYRNTRDLPNCHVVQADLMMLPYPDEAFDLIMADGVLHHTPDTRAAVETLYKKLIPGGEFFFYVYRRMGAARAFCDQHIRETFSKLDTESCFESCEGITELGRELSRLEGKITLTKGIPILDIPPGEHDVQRLLYYGFLKCFWNEAFDWDTNNMVNYDWYHPHNAWQHREEEVEQWLKELGVTEYSFNPANPNGISVVLRKPM